MLGAKTKMMRRRLVAWMDYIITYIHQITGGIHITYLPRLSLKMIFILQAPGMAFSLHHAMNTPLKSRTWRIQVWGQLLQVTASYWESYCKPPLGGTSGRLEPDVVLLIANIMYDASREGNPIIDAMDAENIFISLCDWRARNFIRRFMTSP